MNEPPTILCAHGKPDRLLVAFSDIEMGAGGPFDDFPHSAWLGELILGYADVRYESYAIDLVFNGDTFDLLKTSVEGAYPRHVSSRVGLAKMRRVAEAHPRFFEAIRQFVARTAGRGTVYFVLGNHDAELLFPEVQSFVHDLCGGGDRVRFPGWELDIGRVHIEHGAQHDPLFAMDLKKPTVMHKGEEILQLAWGSVALLDVVIPLQPLLYHHDRLKPKKMLIELMPEMKQLFTGIFWDYWTGDYFRELVRGTDPVKTASWTMLKELVYRMVSFETEVEMTVELRKWLAERDDFDLYLFGHQHDAGWWSFGRRKALRTGCLRDEFMLSDHGRVQRPINKTYGEVFLSGDMVVRSHLVELVAPLRAPGTMPHSIFDAIPEIRRHLAAPEIRSRQLREQRAQEAKEASEAAAKGRS